MTDPITAPEGHFSMPPLPGGARLLSRDPPSGGRRGAPLEGGYHSTPIVVDETAEGGGPRPRGGLARIHERPPNPAPPTRPLCHLFDMLL